MCLALGYAREVYPACAGIDRLEDTHSSGTGRLPRMRGDRPLAFGESSELASFTPHARGSTQSVHFFRYI